MHETETDRKCVNGVAGEEENAGKIVLSLDKNRISSKKCEEREKGANNISYASVSKY